MRNIFALLILTFIKTIIFGQKIKATETNHQISAVIKYVNTTTMIADTVTDLSSANLKGKVKSVNYLNKGKPIKMVSFNSKGFYLEQKHYCPHDITKICQLNKYEYDQNGNLISLSDDYGATKYKYDMNNNMVEQYSISQTGNVYVRTINKYDNNKLISSKYYTYNQNVETLSSEFENVYNSQGKTIKRIDCIHINRPKTDTTIISYTNYIYDERGNLTEENEEKDGRKSHIYTYEYDEKSRKITYRSYSVSGSKYTNYTENYFYDSYGSLIKTIKLTLNKSWINKIEHDYNSNNNLLETRNFNSEGIISRTSYSYLNNLLVEKVEYKKEKLFSKEYYDYDRFGNLTSQKKIDSIGKQISDFANKIEYYP
jgi:YD repeat-containing protein